MAIVNSGSQSSIAGDFLHLASEAIRSEQSSEGALRTAISRVYYAVYLTARDQLFGLDGTGLTGGKRKLLEREFRLKRRRDPGSHDLIIFAITDIQKTPTLNPLTLSQQVGQLKEARIHADYHFTTGKLMAIPEDNWRDYAEKNIALASQLLAVARKLPSYKSP